MSTPEQRAYWREATPQVVIDLLDELERYEIDSAGLTSVCRALAEVFPAAETMAASEAVYALAERAEKAEAERDEWQVRWQQDHGCMHDHLHSLDCSDEVRRNALGEALFFDRLDEVRAEVKRLRDGITALVQPGVTPDGEPLPEWVSVDDLRALLEQS